MRNDVSVVIPTYQGRRFIGTALASVAGQTLPPGEVIVVDDASTDGTADIIAERAASFPCALRLIRLETNSGGPAHPINVGIKAAAGEIIAVLDQDDIFAPDKLAVQVPLLESDATLAFVFSYGGRIAATEPLQGAWIRQTLMDSSREIAGGRHLRGAVALRLLLRYWNYMVGFPAFSFRRSAWAQKGGLDESLKVGGDYDLLCWLCLHGDVGFVPAIHYLRQEHDANASHRRTAMSMEEARIRARYLNLVPELLKDEAFSRGTRDWFFNLAFCMREAGNYANALHCLAWMKRIWGWDRRSLAFLAKLAPHWLYSKATRRPPVASAYTRYGPLPLAAAQTFAASDRAGINENQS